MAGSTFQRCSLGLTTRKYKRFRFHKTRASLFLPKLARDKADFFAHGRVFGTTTFITLRNFSG